MPDLKTRTIQDFGEQWTAFRDNPAYYGSTELLADLRDHYASTLPVESAVEYEHVFNRAVRKRLPRFGLEIEET